MKSYKLISKIFTFSIVSMLFLSCEKNDELLTEIVEDPTEVNDSISVNVNVYNSDAFQDGYTLVSPLTSKNSYLIDMEGYPVKMWKTDYSPGNSVYLLEDGRLLRTAKNSKSTFGQTGGVGGRIEIYSFDGQLEWYYELNGNTNCLHHDVEMLPNGNILMISWDAISNTEAIALGRNPDNITESGIWAEMILEIKPQGTIGGEIVWEWHLSDHFIQDFDPLQANYDDVSSHPELVDINYNTSLNPDLFHANGIEYIEEYDLILLSVHNYCELWIIDHSTISEESVSHTNGARGKGGDLLYRWGNPATYKVGTSNDQLSFYQHDPSWIEDKPSNGGNILFFNNGSRQERSYSTVDEIFIEHDGNGNFELIPNVVNGPSSNNWSFSHVDLFSESISGAQRLENGNTLICEGQDGVFYEVTNDKEIVWKYTVPLEKGSTFRAYRYEKDYPPFSGTTMERLSVEIQ